MSKEVEIFSFFDECNHHNMYHKPLVVSVGRGNKVDQEDGGLMTSKSVEDSYEQIASELCGIDSSGRSISLPLTFYIQNDDELIDNSFLKTVIFLLLTF